MASVLIFFDRLDTSILGKYEVAVGKCIAENCCKSKAKNPPKTHLRNYVSAFRGFVRITGISCLGQSVFEILHIEAKGWESSYQHPIKQAGQNPYLSLIGMGGIRF